MERRHQTFQPELPEGISVGDLRFLNPQTHVLIAAQMGWEVLLEDNINNNPAKVSYSFKREVLDSYDSINLAEQIGIMDKEGNVLSGYTLIINHNEHKTASLEFNFTGFPTKKTMHIICSLEDEFKPKDFQPKILTLLASSENPNPQHKSIKTSLKNLFHK